jgi:hypothetical protein
MQIVSSFLQHITALLDKQEALITNTSLQRSSPVFENTDPKYFVPEGESLVEIICDFQMICQRMYQNITQFKGLKKLFQKQMSQEKSRPIDKRTGDFSKTAL